MIALRVIKLTARGSPGADVVATFLPTLLDRAETIEIFRIAGFQEGLENWRPKYGRFTVEMIE